MYIIISDDLTGAAGISGMISKYTRCLTVDHEHVLKDRTFFAIKDLCLVINTNSRNDSCSESQNKIIQLLNNIKGDFFFKRIDSFMRGNLECEILPFIAKGYKVILTDTIPEYNRFTDEGYTVYKDKKINITEKFNKIKPSIVKNIREIEKNQNQIYIVNSHSYADLREIAKFSIEKGYLLADPGPAIAQVFSMLFKNTNTLKRSFNVGKIIFIVGSNEFLTKKQINYASSFGIPVFHISEYDAESIFDTVIIYFDYLKERYLVKRLLGHLADYDAIVLSGGDTAQFVLFLSGVLYLEAIGELSPLIGISIAKGGILDGKIIITKGGSIGNEGTYLEIIKKLLNLSF
ncbi:MAG: four-carbon acid sugar kinase family protein [Nitrososphaeria archaeon]